MMKNFGGTMRKRMILGVMCAAALALAATNDATIYDIQYTDNPGCEGTYPSLLCGSVVRVSGVVTAVEATKGNVFLTGPQGGEWNSICVEAGSLVNKNRLRPGVMVELCGTVREQFGMTILTNLFDVRTHGVASSIPVIDASTGVLRNHEAYESALVRLQNVSLIEHQGGMWKIDDGSGTCVLEDGFNVLSQQRLQFDSDGMWMEAMGIVTFQFGEFRINPRTVADLGNQTGLHVTPSTSWGRVKSLYQ